MNYLIVLGQVVPWRVDGGKLSHSKVAMASWSQWAGLGKLVVTSCLILALERVASETLSPSTIQLQARLSLIWRFPRQYLFAPSPKVFPMCHYHFPKTLSESTKSRLFARLQTWLKNLYNMCSVCVYTVIAKIIVKKKMKQIMQNSLSYHLQLDSFVIGHVHYGNHLWSGKKFFPTVTLTQFKMCQAFPKDCLPNE